MLLTSFSGSLVSRCPGAVHLVFVAKYRRKIFDLDAIEKLRSYFASVCADFDVELVE
ncbi:transposase, partial [Escherichia coli]